MREHVKEQRIKSLKSCIFSLLVLTLVVSAGTLFLLQQQRKTAQARVTYYTTVLAQAPCIETVCPGLGESPAQVLERLAYSQLVQSRAVSVPHRLGLFFNHGKENVGDGVISFITDVQDTLRMVSDISFHLDDLKLGTVLDTIGDPDQFLFVSGCGMGLRVYAELYYFEKGVKVRIDYSTRRPNTQVLTESTAVWSILYLQPDDFPNHVVESVQSLVGPYNVAYDFHPSVTTDDILAQIRPWPGKEAKPTPSANFCPR
jgi:hypothetical protein